MPGCPQMRMLSMLGPCLACSWLNQGRKANRVDGVLLLMLQADDMCRSLLVTQNKPFNAQVDIHMLR